MLSKQGSKILPNLFPVVFTTKQQVYRFAAWSMLMAETLPDEFPASSFEEVLDAIKKT